MITSKLQGGLGNQIFQWAIAKNLSDMFDIPFELNLDSYKNQIGVTHREFELHKFPNMLLNSTPKNF